MKFEYDNFLQKLKLEHCNSFKGIEDMEYHDRLTLLRCSRAIHVLENHINIDNIQFYKDVTTYKYIAENEWKTDYYIRSERFNSIDEDTICLLKTKQCIITTFHIGSYFSIIGCLLGIAPKICIVVDSKTYKYRKNQLDKYDFSHNDSKILINIESVDGFKQLLNAITNGYSILFYADGNTGLGGVKNILNSIEMSFFNSTIKVKNGIALLSYKFSLPILQIMTYKDQHLHNEYISQKPIMPDKNKNKSEYTDTTTKAMWSAFISHLLKYPAQWEGWLYLHRFHLKLNKKTKISLTDVEVRYILNPMCEFYINNENHYIYNLNNDTTLLISNYIYQLLFRIKSNNYYISGSKINIFISNKDILDILLKQEILIFL